MANYYTMDNLEQELDARLDEAVDPEMINDYGYMDRTPAHEALITLHGHKNYRGTGSVIDFAFKDQKNFKRYVDRFLQTMITEELLESFRMGIIDDITFRIEFGDANQVNSN